MNELPSPLDVLLRAMYRKWNDGDLDGAASLAKVAAPYLHPRLPARRQAAALHSMTDAEIDGLCHDRGDGRADAAALPAGQPA